MNPLDPINNTLQRTQHALAVAAAPQAPAPKPNVIAKIPKKHYFDPRVKPCDQARCILECYKIIDKISAEIDEKLAKTSCPELIKEEKQKLHDTLSENFRLAYLGIMWSPYDFLLTLLTECAHGIESNQKKELIQIFFNELEVVGSGAIKICGVGFLKRAVENLLKAKLPLKDHDLIPKIIEAIFTSELVKQLEAQINKKLADLDIRVNLPAVPSDQEDNVMQSIINAYTQSLRNKIGILDDQKKQQYVDLIHHLRPQTRLWFNKDHPDFVKYMIHFLAFNKFQQVTDLNNNFHIEGLGDPSNLILEIITSIKMARYEMFPGIRLPFKNQYDKKRGSVVPVGDYSMQCVLDTVCGLVRPLIHDKKTNAFIEESDLKMLICRYVRGQVCPVEGAEKFLVERAKSLSLDPKNKTVRKILKDRPSLAKDLENMFPTYVSYLLKDILSGHLHNSPKAALISTVNAIRLLRHHLKSEEIDIILSEMQDSWKDKLEEEPLLKALSIVLDDKRVSVHKRLSLLKLSAYLFSHSQKPSTFNTKEIQVYPRNNENKPAFEISIPNGESTLSLLVDGSDVQESLKYVTEYLKMSKSDEQKKALTTIISQLTPQRPYAGPASSPLYDQMQHFNLSPDELIVTGNLFIDKNTPEYQLLGFNLLCTAQTQVDALLPSDKLLIRLYPLLSNYTSAHGSIDTFIQNIRSMISKELYPTINTLCTKPEKELLFIKDCVLSFSACASGTKVAYALWKKICSRVEFNKLTIADISQSLCKNLQVTDPSTMVEVLNDCANSKLLDFKEQIEWLRKLATFKEPYQLQYAPHIVEMVSTLSCYCLESGSEIEKQQVVHLLSLLPSDHKTSELQEIQDELTPKPPEEKLVVEVVEQVKKPSLTQEEILDKKLKNIRFLIKNFPEQSLPSLKIILSDKSIPLTNKHELIKDVFERLISKRDFAPILKLLRTVEDYQFLNEDKIIFNDLVLKALEAVPNDTPHIEEVISLFEIMLKRNPQIKTTDYKSLGEITIKILDLCNDFEQEYPNAAKLVKNQVPKLLSTLKTQKHNDTFFKLFEKLMKGNLADRVFVENANDFIVLLNIEVNKPHYIKNSQAFISSFLDKCENTESVRLHPTYALLLKDLVKHTHGTKCLSYLTQLASVKKFTTAEDLDFLLSIFKEFLVKNEMQHALRTLKLYVGEKIPASKLKNGKCYFETLDRLLVQNRFSGCLNLLATCPIKIEDPKVQNKIQSMTLTAVKSILSDTEVLTADYFASLWSTVHSLPVDDPALWLLIYEKGFLTQDPQICDKLWLHLENNPRLARDLGPEVSAKLFDLCLSNLKYCTPKLIYKTLSEESKLVTQYKKQLDAKSYHLIYKGLLSAWVTIIKGKAGYKSEDVVARIKEKHSLWMKIIEPKKALALELIFIKSLLGLSESAHLQVVMDSIDKIIEIKKVTPYLFLPEPEWKAVLSTVIKSLAKADGVNESFKDTVTKIGEECLFFKLETIEFMPLIPVLVNYNDKNCCKLGLKLVLLTMKNITEVQFSAEHVKLLLTYKVKELLEQIPEASVYSKDNIMLGSQVLTNNIILFMISKSQQGKCILSLLEPTKKLAIALNDKELALEFIKLYKRSKSLCDLSEYTANGNLFAELVVYFTLNVGPLIDAPSYIQNCSKKINEDLSKLRVNLDYLDRKVFTLLDFANSHLTTYKSSGDKAQDDAHITQLAELINPLIPLVTLLYGHLTRVQKDLITQWALTLKLRGDPNCDKLYEIVKQSSNTIDVNCDQQTVHEFKIIDSIYDLNNIQLKDYLRENAFEEAIMKVCAHLSYSVFRSGSTATYLRYKKVMMKLLPYYIVHCPTRTHQLYKIFGQCLHSLSEEMIPAAADDYVKGVLAAINIIELPKESHLNMLKPLLETILNLKMKDQEMLDCLNEILSNVNKFTKENAHLPEWENIYYEILLTIRNLLKKVELKYDNVQSNAEIKRKVHPLLLNISKSFTKAYISYGQIQKWEEVIRYYQCIARDYLSMKMIDSVGKFDNEDQGVITSFFLICNSPRKNDPECKKLTLSIIEDLVDYLLKAEIQYNVFPGLAKVLAEVATHKGYYTSFPSHLFKQLEDAHKRMLQGKPPAKRILRKR